MPSIIRRRRIKTKKIIGKGWYDKIVNYLVGNNDLKDGEKHAIIWNPNKKSLIKFDSAAYTGPGTRLIEKIKSGVQPKVDSDRVAMAHDLRYSLANNNDDIRAADKLMINKLNDIQNKKSDYKVNILPAKWGIQIKNWLEDKKIMKPESFTKYGVMNEKQEDIDIMKNKLEQLKLDGYGKKKSYKRKKTIKRKK